MRALRLGASWLALYAVLDSPAGGASALADPVAPVRLIAPTSAGSGFDVMGRIVAGGLSERFGQQVVVENGAGAAANVGDEAAARAAPDGYTLLEISATPVVNRYLYPRLGYDLVRDFAPVTRLASSPSVLLVHPSLPVKSVAGLVRLAKARPGALDYASIGVGSATFMPAERFKSMAGVEIVHVPYRGGGEALTAVVSGEVPVYFAPLATALPQVRRGRLRPLAVTAAAPSALLPEVPTIARSGYPSCQATSWSGIVAPAKTPAEIILRIPAALATVLNTPAGTRRLSDLGYVVAGDPPERFAAHLRSEIENTGKLLRRLALVTDPSR